jgi:ElaB/YqjD/DUF883 family membrane-anchored ribosome-binding protein
MSMIDRIQEFEGGYAEQAEELKAQALEYAATARERLAEGNAWVKEYVNKQPVRALGVALGMGVVLGWLIKRR